MIILLDLIAIVAVVHEEVLYNPWQKLWKITLILVIPLFGAGLQLYYLNKIHTPTRKPTDTTATSSLYGYEDSPSCGSDDATGGA